ncbi:hypothetical protein [Leifsonia sp. AG29]|uniref:hypothetical protein n=1 Tax=Leifsonia sp. AG29 TaxID=2598860 RepID=UPI00131B050E|nr:hypothetical protein [Leifsonia sp. AG29]
MPRDRSGALPVWHPERPVGGWSPRAVVDSALDYADLNADQTRDRRRLARAALLALMAELPAVKRAEIEARLRGELAALAAINADDDPELDDEPDAPF